MSTTTHVSPVSGVPARLAEQAKASKSVASVSRRLPVSAGLVSKSVSRSASWPAGSRCYAVLPRASVTVAYGVGPRWGADGFTVGADSRFSESLTCVYAAL
jgi:hypothetical protein